MIASSLAEARNSGLKKYYNECKRHGVQAYAVLDNSCPRCVTDASAARRKRNYNFNRARERFNEVRMRAAEKGHEFNITLEWLRDKLDSTTHCPYLGYAMNTTQEEAKANPDLNKSVDRIDSTKGYMPDNIIICSVRANRIKNNATYEELVMLTETLGSVCRRYGRG